MTLIATAFFTLMALFWAFVSFKDARWEAEENGLSVWDYAAFGIIMMCVSAAYAVLCFVLWLRGV